ncbi:hypothetical protein B0J12DRAFT_778797, partial [Macrophomina phaseolina]
PNRSCNRRTSCTTAAINSPCLLAPTARTTLYRTFARVVRARNLTTSSPLTFMMSNNRRSSAGGNVAVNMTICVSALANSPNSCNFGRKLPRPSNAVWHSSTTIRSNRCRLLNRSKNPPNALVAADSGVTKTTDASSGRRLSHSAAVMPARRHRSTMFSLNEFNGTTTTVVPCSPTAAAHNAGIMNATLLPAPVPITTNNGLRPSTTASTASSCTP